MMDDRFGGRREHLGWHRRRAWREEIPLLQDGSVDNRHDVLAEARSARGQQTSAVDALLSFAAALVALRLGGLLARRRRFAWAAALFSFAAATAAMAWGAAHGWDARSFRVYYLAGALLSAPLLGIGSLLLWGRRWAAPAGLLYAGLAVGVALAMPVHGTFDSTAVPRAQDHLDALPRVLAIGAQLARHPGRARGRRGDTSGTARARAR